MLSEWINGIYLHEFTNSEQEISILHKAASCGIENFEIIVSEWVQVNPGNSRAMSTLIFIIQIECTVKKLVKVWISWSHGVIAVECWIYIAPITPW